MIKILIPQKISEEIVLALNTAGSNEVGGILMGEHVSENIFRIIEISVQSRTGNRFYFFRQLQEALTHLTRFFKRTNYNYRQFNYLGEWHSHPHYMLYPSSTDKETMWDIVRDSRVGANFVILMLVKLTDEKLNASATSYLPNYISVEVEVIFEIN